MRLKINGFGMWVEDQGEGTPLVLIHAFPLDHHVWKSQRDALIDRYRVVLFDMRGFGRSDSTPAPYSMDLLSDDLAALLDDLGIERAVIGGISMGGYVALSFVALHPARVAGLALVDTRATPGTEEARRGREDMMQFARNEGPGAVVRRMLPNLLSRSVQEKRPELVERVATIGAQASLDGVLGALAAMRDRPDSRPRLTEIAVPTLVLVGDQDSITPPADAEALAAAVPGAVLQVIEGAGHLSPLEKPQEVTAALLELLQVAAG
jgi:pimeloyl-ACP methyl ester carboxylesterase